MSATNWHNIPAPDKWWWMWRNRPNDNWQGNRSTRRKPTPVPLCPPQIPQTWPGLEPGRRGGKPETNRLTYAMANSALLLPTLMFIVAFLSVYRWILRQYLKAGNANIFENVPYSTIPIRCFITYAIKLVYLKNGNKHMAGQFRKRSLLEVWIPLVETWVTFFEAANKERYDMAVRSSDVINEQPSLKMYCSELVSSGERPY
jgi:hypothetical protein